MDADDDDDSVAAHEKQPPLISHKRNPKKRKQPLEIEKEVYVRKVRKKEISIIPIIEVSDSDDDAKSTFTTTTENRKKTNIKSKAVRETINLPSVKNQNETKNEKKMVLIELSDSEDVKNLFINNKYIKKSSEKVKNTICDRKSDNTDTRIKTNSTDNVCSTLKTVEKMVINEEDLQQYVGDISDLDFGDVEMEDLTKPQNSNVNQTQKLICDSQKKKSEPVSAIQKSNPKTAILNQKQIDNVLQKKNTNFESNKCTVQPTSQNKSYPLPMAINASGNKVFRFFWMDAFEDSYSCPGTVYLFGRVFNEITREFLSCCVAIKNIPRKIYVLPKQYIINSNGNKEPNTLNNVYSEIKQYMNKKNISEFRSLPCKKTYVFDKKNVPQHSEYLEIKYSASYAALDSNYSGPTIETIFGTSVSALELFLIEKNIKGPCWLDVKIPSNHPTKFPLNNPFSWCKLEVTCPQMGEISVTRYQQKISEVPSLVVASLNVQTILDSKSQSNEISTIGLLINKKYPLNQAPSKPLCDEQICIINRIRSINWPSKSINQLPKDKHVKIIYCDNEVDFFEKFLETLHHFDPDVVISNDSEFQFETILYKIFTLRITNWSRIGKLKVYKAPNFRGKIYLNQVSSGRPVCDIQKSVKELNLKINSYDLNTISSFVLQNKCLYKEIKPEECVEYYASIQKLENLIRSTIEKSSCILQICIKLNILPLAIQMTSIAGNTLSRTLSAGVAERIEFLLLHAFHANNYLTPDKKKEKDDAAVDQKKLSGGIVLEPKKGFYDRLVLMMDFNSLYPTIIQEFNICFTTIRGAASADVDDLSLSEAIKEPGILPREIQKLVESRAQIKKMMQSENLSPDLRQVYSIRQQALKLMANSVFGCLGSPYSRFYSKGLAGLVTTKGREIFQNTKEIVEGFNYEVIYGDTDSIAINTKLLDYEEVMNIGRDIKRKVNKLYKKVELDIDQIFRFMLLLKKKQYAVIRMKKLSNGEIQLIKEVKGLEIIKRDWCSLACDVGNQILDQILTGQSCVKNILKILETVRKSLQERTVPLKSLEISKQIIKNLQAYSAAKHLAHIVVARRLNKVSARKWKEGDTISYIICEDGTDRTALERAYHISELEANSCLKFDLKYYLLNQIHPIVYKICEPIQGIDDVLIAQNLGVEKLYKPKSVIQTQEMKVPLLMHGNRYANCQSFKFKCRNCKSENEIKTLIIQFPAGSQPSLSMCSNPNCNSLPWKYEFAIENKLQLDIRNFVSKYYLAEVECDNPLCFHTVKRISLDENSSHIKCSNCLNGNIHRIYKEIDLHNQLSFYLQIFTLRESDYEDLTLRPTSELIETYNNIKEFLLDEIENNAYFLVNLTNLFSFIKQRSDRNQVTLEDNEFHKRI